MRQKFQDNSPGKKNSIDSLSPNIHEKSPILSMIKFEDYTLTFSSNIKKCRGLSAGNTHDIYDTHDQDLYCCNSLHRGINFEQIQSKNHNNDSPIQEAYEVIKKRKNKNFVSPPQNGFRMLTSSAKGQPYASDEIILEIDKSDPFLQPNSICEGNNNNNNVKMRRLNYHYDELNIENHKRYQSSFYELVKNKIDFDIASERIKGNALNPNYEEKLENNGYKLEKTSTIMNMKDISLMCESIPLKNKNDMDKNILLAKKNENSYDQMVLNGIKTLMHNTQDPDKNALSNKIKSMPNLHKKDGNLKLHEFKQVNLEIYNHDDSFGEYPKDEVLISPINAGNIKEDCLSLLNLQKSLTEIPFQGAIEEEEREICKEFEEIGNSTRSHDKTLSPIGNYSLKIPNDKTYSIFNYQKDDTKLLEKQSNLKIMNNTQSKDQQSDNTMIYSPVSCINNSHLLLAHKQNEVNLSIGDMNKHENTNNTLQAEGKSIDTKERDADDMISHDISKALLRFPRESNDESKSGDHEIENIPGNINTIMSDSQRQPQQNEIWSCKSDGINERSSSKPNDQKMSSYTLAILDDNKAAKWHTLESSSNLSISHKLVPNESSSLNNSQPGKKNVDLVDNFFTEINLKIENPSKNLQIQSEATKHNCLDQQKTLPSTKNILKIHNQNYKVFNFDIQNDQSTPISDHTNKHIEFTKNNVKDIVISSSITEQSFLSPNRDAVGSSLTIPILENKLFSGSFSQKIPNNSETNQLPLEYFGKSENYDTNLKNDVQQDKDICSEVYNEVSNIIISQSRSNLMEFQNGEVDLISPRFENINNSSLSSRKDIKPMNNISYDVKIRPSTEISSEFAGIMNGIGFYCRQNQQKDISSLKLNLNSNSDSTGQYSSASSSGAEKNSSQNYNALSNLDSNSNNFPVVNSQNSFENIPTSQQNLSSLLTVTNILSNQSHGLNSFITNDKNHTDIIENQSMRIRDQSIIITKRLLKKSLKNKNHSRTLNSLIRSKGLDKTKNSTNSKISDIPGNDNTSIKHTSIENYSVLNHSKSSSLTEKIEINNRSDNIQDNFNLSKDYFIKRYSSSLIEHVSSINIEPNLQKIDEEIIRFGSIFDSNEENEQSNCYNHINIKKEEPNTKKNMIEATKNSTQKINKDGLKLHILQFKKLEELNPQNPIKSTKNKQKIPEKINIRSRRKTRDIDIENDSQQNLDYFLTSNDKSQDRNSYLKHQHQNQFRQRNLSMQCQHHQQVRTRRHQSHHMLTNLPLEMNSNQDENTNRPSRNKIDDTMNNSSVKLTLITSNRSTHRKSITPIACLNDNNSSNLNVLIQNTHKVKPDHDRNIINNEENELESYGLIGINKNQVPIKYSKPIIGLNKLKHNKENLKNWNKPENKKPKITKNIIKVETNVYYIPKQKNDLNKINQSNKIKDDRNDIRENIYPCSSWFKKNKSQQYPNLSKVLDSELIVENSHNYRASYKQNHELSNQEHEKQVRFIDAINKVQRISSISTTNLYIYFENLFHY